MIDNDPLVNGLIEAISCLDAGRPEQRIALTDLAARHLLARPINWSAMAASPENLAKTLASRWDRAMPVPLPTHLRSWLAELSAARSEADEDRRRILGERDACLTLINELRGHVLATLRRS